MLKLIAAVLCGLFLFALSGYTQRTECKYLLADARKESETVGSYLLGERQQNRSIRLIIQYLECKER